MDKGYNPRKKYKELIDAWEKEDEDYAAMTRKFDAFTRAHEERARMIIDQIVAVSEELGIPQEEPAKGNHFTP
jgi:hypothetical protein